MTDRDKLIELLHLAPTEFGKTKNDLTDNRCFVEFAADYLLANGVTLGKPLVEYLHPIDAYEGLKGKYLVFKADTGEQIVDCFVLRPDKDNIAAEALRFYAYTTENKTLAEDIYTWVGKSKILPPCKVGDVVYFANESYHDAAEIDGIQIDATGISFTWVQYEVGVDITELWDEGDFDLEDIGKTVFLTKEEAERKLKELKDNVTKS